MVGREGKPGRPAQRFSASPEPAGALEKKRPTGLDRHQPAGAVCLLFFLRLSPAPPPARPPKIAGAGPALLSTRRRSPPRKSSPPPFLQVRLSKNGRVSRPPPPAGVALCCPVVGAASGGSGGQEGSDGLVVRHGPLFARSARPDPSVVFLPCSRPTVSIFSEQGESSGSLPLPAVLTAPIRLDVVQQVHKSMAKNKRQAYSVASNAGEQTSAQSWGTGRAVARIPRVGGSGTHRSGQVRRRPFCLPARLAIVPD